MAQAAASLTADTPDDCRLPRRQRMRYWKPAPALAGLVSGYHLYAVEVTGAEPHRDVFQPGWANLRFLLTRETDWRIRLGGGAWQSIGECALFGPTSVVAWSKSGSGVVVGAGLTPLGWSRMSSVPAAEWANKVGGCAAVLGADVAALRTLLLGAASDDALPVLLDAFLIGALGRAGKLETAIGRLDQALLDPGVDTVAALAERVGLTPRSLERLAARAFGFAPKLLLRRARFLRSLHAIRLADAADRSAAIDAGYTDYSHFVRDAHEFLGMSPQAFLKLDNPLFVQSAKLREQVLGAPAQALGSGGT